MSIQSCTGNFAVNYTKSLAGILLVAIALIICLATKLFQIIARAHALEAENHHLQARPAELPHRAPHAVDGERVAGFQRRATELEQELGLVHQEAAERAEARAVRQEQHQEQMERLRAELAMAIAQRDRAVASRAELIRIHNIRPLFPE